MTYLSNIVPFFGSVFSSIRSSEIGLVLVGISFLTCVILSVRRLVRCS